MEEKIDPYICELLTNYEQTVKVMHAFLEGKKVQYRIANSTCNSTWIDINHPSFALRTVTGKPIEWRVKPEPRVLYQNVYEDGYIGEIYISEKQAKEGSDRRPVQRIVKFVEVLED